MCPPAYRWLGYLPAEQFIPDPLAHLGEPYYVGLLSAAKYHGAGHPAPMVFQVVVPTSRRGLQCGDVRAEFVARQNMHETPVIERNAETGTIRIATPEATVLEFVGYPERCGYLDNVATVLAEFSESMSGDLLAAETRWSSFSRRIWRATSIPCWQSAPPFRSLWPHGRQRAEPGATADGTLSRISK